MQYEKFQIADFTSGERGDKKPWRSLATSWRELSNCAPYKGQLKARPGYDAIGKKLWHKVSETFAGTAGLLTFSDNCQGFEVEPGFVTWTSGPRNFADDGAGVIKEGVTPVGTINYVTGAWTITVGVAFPNDLVINFRAWMPANGCVGIIEFTDNDSIRHLVACSTRRVFRWETTHFVDVTGTNVFTGSENDLMWFCPFENWLIITNGIDAPKKYIPAAGTVTDLATNFDGIAGNDITRAKIILNHKGRLLFINVREAAVNFSHRARRTKPNDPEGYYNALDFSDAPTGEPILSAGIVGDTVVCLCDGNQAFAHRYRGDPKFLYDWVNISYEAGSAATHTTIRVEGGLIVLAEQSIQSCDGRTMQRIDNAIIDWARDNIDRTKLSSACGALFHSYKQAWLSLFKIAATQKSLLVLDMERGAWAEFDMSFWVYGSARSDTFQDIAVDAMPDLPADSFEESPDSYLTGGTSVRTMLGGTRDGIVRIIEHSYTDDAGLPFTVYGLSQLLNPWIDKGLDASLGWVDLQMSRHDGHTVVVRLYRNFDETPYAETTLSLTGAGTEQTVRRRVPANSIAQFHAIEFETQAPGFHLDALEPYFAPARRMFETPIPA